VGCEGDEDVAVGDVELGIAVRVGNGIEGVGVGEGFDEGRETR